MSSCADLEIRNVETYKFNTSDLVQIRDSGGYSGAIYNSLEIPYQMMQIESWGNHISVFSKISNETKNAILYWLRKCAEKFQKKSQIPKISAIPSSNIIEFFASQRTVVGIANRDGQWVGNSQPWRDTDIDNFIPTISYLIESRFSVIRLNTVGKNVAFPTNTLSI